MRIARRMFLTCLGGAFAAQTAAAAAWNQWRGPLRNGVVPSDFSWPTSLSGEHLVELWRIPLQPSYSGPIVADDQVFVTETVDKKQEVVRSFSIASGEQLWRSEWQGAMSVPFFARSNGSWIRSTPAWSDGKLLVGGMRDALVCLDATTGAVIWRNELPTTQSSKMPTFGCVCSPLIEGDHAFMQAAGGLVKLEMATGKVIWRVLDDGGGMNGSAFSSPILANLLGTRMLIVQTRSQLAGVSPESGKVLWSVDIPSFRGMNILTPTVSGASVLTSSYGGGSFRFDISGSTDEGFTVAKAWQNRIQGYMSSPVLIDGHLYLHLRNQRLTCLNVDTGKQKWSSTPFGKYWSSVTQGNQMLALDERGELLLVSPNPEEFTLVDRRKVASDSWAHVAIAADLIFVRDLESLAVYRWS